MVLDVPLYSWESDMKMKCKCCGERMVPVVWGFPSPGIFAKAERGKVILGGCVIEPGAPKFQCPKCNALEEEEYDV